MVPVNLDPSFHAGGVEALFNQVRALLAQWWVKLDGFHCTQGNGNDDCVGRESAVVPKGQFNTVVAVDNLGDWRAQVDVALDVLADPLIDTLHPVGEFEAQCLLVKQAQTVIG